MPSSRSGQSPEPTVPSRLFCGRCVPISAVSHLLCKFHLVGVFSYTVYPPCGGFSERLYRSKSNVVSPTTGGNDHRCNLLPQPSHSICSRWLTLCPVCSRCVLWFSVWASLSLTSSCHNLCYDLDKPHP